MLRATGWTVGLFGAGATLARLFPAAWIEPVVLLALGIAFLFVSRTRASFAPKPRANIVAKIRTRAAVAPKQAPAHAPATVPVEQSA